MSKANFDVLATLINAGIDVDLDTYGLPVEAIEITAPDQE